ncbi:ATP synthase F1 subunit delta [Blautia sp. OF03-15BH]|uniref:ATP synthase F1 subunit delta n=1 Tax=Blautia sp. OF03-15BH TaxID=2292287 RepID=UPI000E4CF233|nr:ATP synthase F1 subunit delta [Blautia sp. OF03-15BH]RGY01296.1 ATP synthase F1 subunit delta [Blautia sp. OF03-15BH]
MTQAARVYGESMYELALSEGLSGEILEEMKVIRRLFQENPDYVHLLSESSIPGNERIDLIETAFGKQAERYLVNFIKLLCEKNLLREFGGCCDEYLRRYNQDNGIAEATATSAVPLTEAQAEALKQKLEKLSGKKISLSLKTNPSLLGGVRVELEGKELDGTVKGRLDGLSRKLDSLTL